MARNITQHSGNWREWLGRVVGIVMAIPVLYALAGLAGGMIPVNLSRTPVERGVRIYIEDNGIHTGIVVPVVAAGVDWRGTVRPQDIADPRYAVHSHLAFGWGDRAFYIGTPTWADLRLPTVARAAIGSDDTVLHVEHVAQPQPRVGVRSIVLSPAEYRRLSEFLRASFAPGPDGRAPSVTGYGPHDAFYAARGRYTALRTCNSWTGEALRHAGVRMGAWTPFPITVMMWL